MSDGVIFESICGIYNFDGEKKNLLLLFLRGVIMAEVLFQGGCFSEGGCLFVLLEDWG